MTKDTNFNISTLVISIKNAYPIPIVHINLTWSTNNLYHFAQMKIQRWKLKKKLYFQIWSTYHFQFQSSKIQALQYFSQITAALKTIRRKTSNLQILGAGLMRYSANMVNYCTESDTKQPWFHWKWNIRKEKKNQSPMIWNLKKRKIR